MNSNLVTLEGFQLRIHGMPCVNECSHCHSFGMPGSAMMSCEEIVKILEQAAELKKHLPLLALLYLYEPTVHPSFVEIFEKQSELGLVVDNHTFPSNCYGLARIDDDGWRRLKEAGLDHLAMAFHGVGWEHDATAGRRRAFRDLMTTIEKANEHDINWTAEVMVRTEIIERVPTIVDYLSKYTTNPEQVSTTVFNWLGRGAADELRPVESDLDRLPLNRDEWMSERQCVERITSDPDLSGRQVSDVLFKYILMELFSDYTMCCAGGFDSAPPAEFLPFLNLGTLDERGLHPFAEEYVNELPLPMKLLKGMTWGELAERYGDRENDHLYQMMSVARQKWATIYLREELPRKGRGGGIERKLSHTW